jgi:hypothetical protein
VCVRVCTCHYVADVIDVPHHYQAVQGGVQCLIVGHCIFRIRTRIRPEVISSS